MSREVPLEISVVGAGGLGREVAAMLRSAAWSEPYRVVGFWDDGLPKGSMPLPGCPVLGTVSDLLQADPRALVVGIGNPAIKLDLGSRLAEKGHSFPNLVHPSAILTDPESLQWGKGAVMGPGVCITTQVRIGDFVLFNLNTTVGHDVTLERGVSLMPGVHLSGGVYLEEGVLVGSGAVLINAVRIGRFATVGAGSVVNRSVAAHTTVVGVPARSVDRLT